jgi:hypothetical protein
MAGACCASQLILLVSDIGSDLGRNQWKYIAYCHWFRAYCHRFRRILPQISHIYTGFVYRHWSHTAWSLTETIQNETLECQFAVKQVTASLQDK